MIPMSVIGKRIKEELKLKNIKQEDLAKKIGINKGTLSNYITGKRVMPIDLFVKLCETIDTDILKIIYGEKNYEQVEMEVIVKYREQNEEMKNMINKILDIEPVKEKKEKDKIS